MLAALALLVGFAALRRGSRPGWRLALSGVAAGLFVLQFSCGGAADEGVPVGPPGGPPGGSGTPAGTYPVTITASSGSGATALSRTASLTLTVTP